MITGSTITDEHELEARVIDGLLIRQRLQKRERERESKGNEFSKRESKPQNPKTSKP